ncbi:uncharacterized protein LOC111112603 [Crassostrea virginica]
MRIMRRYTAVFVTVAIASLTYLIFQTYHGEKDRESVEYPLIIKHQIQRNQEPFNSTDAKRYEKLKTPYTVPDDKHKNCLLTLPPKLVGFGELPIAIPESEDVKSLSPDVIACLYHRYVTTIQVFCGLKDRAGEVKRNGWYVCKDPTYEPKQNGVVFLSNKAFPEKTFSDDMTSRYKCRVFNTSITSTNTLQSWILKTNISQSNIEILTLSFSNTSELETLDRMIQDKSIKRVRQLFLELYFDPAYTTTESYILLLQRFKMLYDSGFRIMWFDQLIHCATSKFNKCYAVYFVQPNLMDKSKNITKVEIPPVAEIQKMNGNQIADLYFKYIETTQYFCQHVIRVGRITDGGWNVCHDVMKKMKSCLVYSFGVFKDLSFDDEVSNAYGCRVFAFDPTTPFDTHQHSPNVWFYRLGLGNSYRKFSQGYVAPLSKIRADFGHQSEPIAILKADIEGAEWSSVPNIVSTNQVANVSQLFLEFHGYGNVANQLIVLKMLHDAGFRIFWYHINPACTFNKSMLRRSNCQEVYFVNTKFNANNS